MLGDLLTIGLHGFTKRHPMFNGVDLYGLQVSLAIIGEVFELCVRIVSLVPQGSQPLLKAAFGLFVSRYPCPKAHASLPCFRNRSAGWLRHIAI